MLKKIMEAINQNQGILEFRAANQRPQILGNRVEMEIARLVEKNDSLLRLGLNLDVPDARMRVAHKLQQNSDNREFQLSSFPTSQLIISLLFPSSSSENRF